MYVEQSVQLRTRYLLLAGNKPGNLKKLRWPFAGCQLHCISSNCVSILTRIRTLDYLLKADFDDHQSGGSAAFLFAFPLPTFYPPYPISSDPFREKFSGETWNTFLLQFPDQILIMDFSLSPFSLFLSLSLSPSLSLSSVLLPQKYFFSAKF